MLSRLIRPVWLFACAIGVCAVIVHFLFDFHYPHGVDNDPLKSPVRVISVQRSLLLLEDGRNVLVQSEVGRLSDLIEASGNRIDIELDDNTGTATVFVKSELAGCGDPFIMVRMLFPPYQKPLIPDDFPLNYRRRVGSGRLDLE